MMRVCGIVWVLVYLLSSLHASALDTIISTKITRVHLARILRNLLYQPRTQELIGIDIDLAKALAKNLGADVLFIESSFANFISDLQQKRCDIAMFAIGHTPERKAQVTLTSPHLQSDVYAIATKK